VSEGAAIPSWPAPPGRRSDKPFPGSEFRGTQGPSECLKTSDACPSRDRNSSWLALFVSASRERLLLGRNRRGGRRRSSGFRVILWLNACSEHSDLSGWRMCGAGQQHVVAGLRLDFRIADLQGVFFFALAQKNVDRQRVVPV
jgi:hypothetical protein